MLKKISFFALAALFIVGCSSNPNEDETKNRNFKDSVYAFINSNPRLVGFGKVNIDAIMKDGDVSNNATFQMFAGPTFEEFKGQLDVKTPLYLAMEVPEMGGDPTVYIMAKLKDKKAFKKTWTDMGYMFRESKGVSYAEDDEQLIAFRNETVIMVMIPRDYNGAVLAPELFAFADGKIASDKMKKQIDASGDFVMHFDVDRFKETDPSLSMIPKGMEADLSLNFEKGKMIFEATSNNVAAMQKQFGVKKLDTPVLAKKITTADGQVLMAMQLSISSALMDLAMMNDDAMEEAMINISMRLAELDASLTLSDITDTDNIMMPGSGKPMGSAPAEVMIDFKVLSALFPQFQAQMESLDYATYIMEDDKVRVVIASNAENENFLTTVFKAVDAFVMSGGLMQMAAMN